MTFKPTHIILHHSLTKDGREMNWADQRRYHMSWKFQGNSITEARARELIGQGAAGVEPPWTDIGYNYGVELVGDRYEILVGRMLGEPGAHCKQGGMNLCSIGVLVNGNFDKDEVPHDQLALTIRLVKAHMNVLGIPKENIKRHSDYAAYKSCPGTKFPWSSFLSAL